MSHDPAAIASATMSPESRRAFWLLVGNGAIVTMGSVFYSFETVMAGLAFDLTGSTLLVGLLTAVATSGWFWPQIFVGNFIQDRPLKMPVYRLSASLRVSGLSAMIAATWFLSDRGHLLYWVILLCVTLFSTGGGICVIPFLDILSKTVPVSHRPMLMAYRQSIGGCLGFAAGLITVYVLSDRSGLSYPLNYVVLFITGGLINSVAYGCFIAIREPVEEVESERKSFGAFFAGGMRVFRDDRDFRYYYYFRVCLYLAYMSQALLVPFAMDRFHTPLQATGLFAAGIALTGGLFSLLWGRVARRIGAPGLFRIVSALTLAPCAFMASLALLPEGATLAAAITPHFHWVVLGIFACLTAARQGIDMGGNLYLLALPTAKQRPTYFAFMNSLSAPLMLSPMLGGWIAEHLSFQAAFLISLFAAGGMFLVSLQLRHR